MMAADASAFDITTAMAGVLGESPRLILCFMLLHNSYQHSVFIL